MSAQPSQPDDLTFAVVVGRTKLSTVWRSISVQFTRGRSPAIDISRQFFDGKDCGFMRMHHESFPTLRLAIAAVRAGTVGLVGLVPLLREGLLAFDVPRPGELAIGFRGATGIAQGRPSILMGAEIDRLEEALVIATRPEIP